MMDNQKLRERLQKPAGPVDVVLDTDAFNEVDDQFAIAYLLRSAPRLRTAAICAAPFQNHKAASPEEGMALSFREIEHMVALCGIPDGEVPLYRGAGKFLRDEASPVDSDAARAIVALALAQPADRPLYVVAIGAITNVASALLLQPDIREKIVVVWLGGHAQHWPDTKEFNMFQDVAAARVVFDSGAPLVQLPCMGVVSHLQVSGAELEQYVRDSPLGRYLRGIVQEEENPDGSKRFWSRVLWDVAAVSWLVHPGFTECHLIPSPMPTYDGYYAHSPGRHPIQYVYHIHRAAVLDNLFDCLNQ